VQRDSPSPGGRLLRAGRPRAAVELHSGVTPEARLQILQAAVRALGEHGWDALDLSDLARAAGVPIHTFATEFPRKDFVALALYDRIAAETSERAADLPEGPAARRFAAATRIKLAAIRPHRAALTGLLRDALDPARRAWVGSRETARVRRRVGSVFAAAVHGASDAPADPRQRARLAHLAYVLHLLVVLAWVLDEASAEDAVEATASAMGLLPFAAMIPGAFAAAERLAARLLPVELEPGARQTADAILDRLLSRARFAPGTDRQRAEALVRETWGERVAAVVAANEPLELVLPGFPAKSPNPEKVLGRLPDRAERLALANLEALCVELEGLHPAGVHMVLASDGHVFVGSVGIGDDDCDVYRDTIREELVRAGARHLRWFDLGDAYPRATPEEQRERLLSTYGEPLEALKARGPMPMVDGIHRFLAEDARGVDPSLSKNQAKERTREAAWETVRRSQAWGALVAAAFPDAVRLSIHPQPAGSPKLGLHLLPTDDPWLTPWHGCALLTREGFCLVKRGDHPDAQVSFVEGRPDHLVAPGVIP
jgi:pyoverdine/dityrosine biosynthesis protein Dit1/AcrR family transcriptional regulator